MLSLNAISLAGEGLPSSADSFRDAKIAAMTGGFVWGLHPSLFPQGLSEGICGKGRERGLNDAAGLAFARSAIFMESFLAKNKFQDEQQKWPVIAPWRSNALPRPTPHRIVECRNHGQT